MAESKNSLLRPGDEFEKYTVEQELGHGGMGAVYLVRHRVLNTNFALKVLYPGVAQRDQQFVDRFIREAQLAGRIRHPNLIAVYDAGLNESNGMYYLVMDYVSGGSVRSKLRKEHLVLQTESDGFRYHLSADCPHASDGRIADLVTGRMQPDVWFKQTRRRHIMSYDGLLIKLYIFHGFSDVRHSRRYASREVECYHDYLKAFGSMPGVRLPKLYGYFEKPFMGFLFRANGIIEEFIPGTRILGMEELNLIPPLFAHLYRKGIYHPDMQFQNVLWQPDTRTLVPIDYMGCNILPEPNWEALLMQLSWFLKAADVDDAHARPFMEDVLALLPELHLDHEKAWRCIKALYEIPVETHQYHHPIFLPPELRRQTQPDE